MLTKYPDVPEEDELDPKDEVPSAIVVAVSTGTYLLILVSFMYKVIDTVLT